MTVDVFSTWSDGRPYGNRELCWVDTESKEWGKVGESNRLIILATNRKGEQLSTKRIFGVK